MSLRDWSREHTLGLLLGILTILLCIPLAIFIYSVKEDISFSILWDRFTFIHEYSSKFISLASIPNLLWFHFFLKKEEYGYGKGIVVATILSLLTIVYFKFIA
jgi:hypothetical protein